MTYLHDFLSANLSQIYQVSPDSDLLYKVLFLYRVRSDTGSRLSSI